MSIDSFHDSILSAGLLVEFYAEIQKDELEYILFVFWTAIAQSLLNGKVGIVSKGSTNLSINDSDLFFRIFFFKLFFNFFITDATWWGFFSCKVFAFHPKKSFLNGIHFLWFLRWGTQFAALSSFEFGRTISIDRFNVLVIIFIFEIFIVGIWFCVRVGRDSFRVFRLFLAWSWLRV